MSDAWTAAVIALFVWWFSTGAILVAVRRADRLGGGAYAATTWAALPVLVAGLAAVMYSAGSATVAGVYAGFLGALAVWGWVELAFLTGTITGPEKRPQPAALETGRFIRAWRTVAWHELSLLAGLLIIAIITIERNDVALWTYLVLFVARISAKLNLFFGVPRINTEFIPKPLTHLSSYFRQGQITVFFPFSIVILGFGFTRFFLELTDATGPEAVVAFALLSALSGLALVEHWLMVVPLPDAKLWRWMLPAPPALTAKERQSHDI